MRPTYFGTGDWEDDPEIRDDRSVETFYIEYETSTGLPRWVGGGQFSTFNEAKAAAEHVCNNRIIWDVLPLEGAQ